MGSGQEGHRMRSLRVGSLTRQCLATNPRLGAQVRTIYPNLPPADPKGPFNVPKGVPHATPVPISGARSEYDELIERDPYAVDDQGILTVNTGPNDEVFGEWGLDLDAQFLSSGHVLAWWFGGFGFFYGIYKLVGLYNP